MNLELLRQKINAIEWNDAKSSAVVSFGNNTINEMLPQGGLKVGCLHEWTGSLAPVTAVCSSILARLAQTNGPILWCSTRMHIYPAGLMEYGLLSHQVIFAKPQTQKEILWAAEEALKTPQLGAVVAEVSHLSLVQSRRLQLCSQKSGVTLFLLLDKSTQSISNTSLSHWLIEPLPSENAPGLWKDNGIKAPRFSVTLRRYKGANTPQKWNLEWNATTLSFDILSKNQLSKVSNA